MTRAPAAVRPRGSRRDLEVRCSPSGRRESVRQSKLQARRRAGSRRRCRWLSELGFPLLHRRHRGGARRAGWSRRAGRQTCLHLRRRPAAQPGAQVRSAARNPPGAAKALAALARFANGQLGDFPYDRRLAAALGKWPGGRAIAKRIVSPYEAMSVADRGAIFVGEQELDKLTIRTFDRARFEAARARQAAACNRRRRPPARPRRAQGESQYELVYRGMKVTKTADADGADEPVVSPPCSHPARRASRTSKLRGPCRNRHPRRGRGRELGGKRPARCGRARAGPPGGTAASCS